ncbi:hypothetical protein KUTeg_006419 [Tegillarca granosa]|uniref:Kringle domain-containing protein n=1 Tax=Tegillarca granosa TaxID=220873 RepID=A0ABQ9FJE1_TEGGR|nr:hypothetical protein KUTeg_006419 [Tegillarca granosa]
MGKEYRGTINITAMGIQCQQWSVTTPHSHSWNSEPSNYCRNPDNEHYGPWCYTTDPTVRWQYCDVPFCVYSKEAKECKTTTLGYEYYGIANTTITGRECQAWVLDTPHDHSNNELPGNECRNPDASPNGPWCYTTDVSSRWEYCNIPFC